MKKHLRTLAVHLLCRCIISQITKQQVPLLNILLTILLFPLAFQGLLQSVYTIFGLSIYHSFSFPPNLYKYPLSSTLEK